MIILLDDSITHLVDSDTYDPTVTTALDIISSARRDGNHYVFGNPHLLGLLRNYPPLSAPSRSVYQKILNTLPTTRGLVDYVGFKIIVGNFSEFEFISQQNALKIPLSFFNIQKKLIEPILLCENLSDCQCYEKFANLYAQHKNIKGVFIKFERHGGGGNTIADEYKEIQNNFDRFCLCICDSDTSYPKATYGDTAKKVITVDTPEKLTSSYFILESRMIENLIPTVLLEKAINGNSEKKAALDIIRRIEKSKYYSYRQHLHLKKGFYLYDILKHKLNRTYYNYWSDILSFAHEPGIQTEECIHECATPCRPCKHNILFPLGSNILELVLHFIDNYTAEELERDNPDFLTEEILKVGKLCFGWGCSPGPLVAS